MLGVQFTEPVVILSKAGLVQANLEDLGADPRRLELWLFLSWLFIQVAAQILLRSTLYNNFRHLLFIPPFLFIFAGVALEAIISGLDKGPPYLRCLSAGFFPPFASSILINLCTTLLKV